MKVFQYLFAIVLLSLTMTSCSSSDDDTDDDFRGDTYFVWNTPSLPYTAAVTATYSGGGLQAFAESHQKDDIGVNIRIIARVDGEGIYTLNKNDSDPDDNYVMEYTYKGNLYITTSVHSIELDIEVLDESKKEMVGSFTGEVVNKDDPTDVIPLTQGAFLLRYF